MDALHNLLSRLRTSPVARDERGMTAIEYALIGVLVGIAIIGGVTTFGTSLNAKFTLVKTAVASLPGK
ncbi:MAG TPA: Flp family type IVb pilin [Acetobacteraceae bacterium]